MFFGTLMTMLFKVVILAAVGITGILAGKKLRDRKDAKSDNLA